MKTIKEEIFDAIEAGYTDWTVGYCRDDNCGCVTEYIKGRVGPIIDRQIYTIGNEVAQ